MELTATNICRLCLKQCQDFEAIAETHHEVLSTLLVSLNLAISQEPVMCKICAEKLQICFAFKSASLYAKNELKFSNGQDSAVDVCLFCKKLSMFGPFVFLNSDEIDILLLKAMMSQYFPELNLHTISKPVICTTCHGLLQGNFEFIVCCLSVEERIRKFCEIVGSNSKGQIQLVDVVHFGTEISMEQDDCCSGFDVVKVEENWGVEKELSNDIKIEDGGGKIIAQEVVNKVEVVLGGDENLVEREIKVENVDDGTECSYEEIDIDTKDILGDKIDTLSESIENVVKKWGSYDDDSMEIPDNVGEKECFNENDEKTGLEEGKARKKVVRKKWWTPFNDRSPQTFPKTVLRSMITRIDVSGEKKYQCQVCHFVAKAKCSMNRHMLLHQDPSEITLYECHVCGFKSKQKFDLRQHIKRHGDRSEANVYKCEHCPLETKYKNNLRLHQAVHNTTLQVPKYECYVCSFKASHKNSLQCHMRKHNKRVKYPRVFTCDKCFYKSNCKSYLKAHMKTHMHPSEVVMYKCKYCSHETKLRKNWVVHMETHRDPVKCEHCDFKSKHNGTLNKHVRRCHMA